MYIYVKHCVYDEDKSMEKGFRQSGDRRDVSAANYFENLKVKCSESKHMPEENIRDKLSLQKAGRSQS
jgi:hypothetical protein